MSGAAVGWVGMNGPRPDDVDRNGVPYGARARGYKFVLLGIADAANYDGQHAHPGMANLSAFSLYSLSQTKRICWELEAEGWVHITQAGGGRGQATVYDLILTRRDDPAPTPANRRVQTNLNLDEKGARDAPVSETTEAVNRRVSRETGASGGAANGLTTTDKEKEQTTGAKRAPEARPDDFAVFYDRYPRKQARPAALRAFNKAMKAKVDPDLILSGLEAWCAFWIKDKTPKNYIPQPSRFLNDHRWNDEPVSGSARKPAAEVEADLFAGRDIVPGRVIM